MVEDNFKEIVKVSFLKVKEDIDNLNKELSIQKQVLSRQNDVLRIINDKLNQVIQRLSDIEGEIPKIPNQSIINQSLINHLITQKENGFKASINEKKESSIGNKGVLTST